MARPGGRLEIADRGMTMTIIDATMVRWIMMTDAGIFRVIGRTVIAVVL